MLCNADCDRCKNDVDCPMGKIRCRTINVIGDVNDDVAMLTYKGVMASISVSTIPLDEDKTIFKMACAFRSPKDRFDREHGHFISTRRLLTAPDNRKSIRVFQKKADEKLIDTIKMNCIDVAKKMGIRWMEEVTLDDLK